MQRFFFSDFIVIVDLGLVLSISFQRCYICKSLALYLLSFFLKKLMLGNLAFLLYCRKTLSITEKENR